MTSGQMRVMMLLVVLFMLEAIRFPAVSSFWRGAINGFNSALNDRTKP